MGAKEIFLRDTNGLMYRQLPMIMSLMGLTLRRRWISIIIVLAIFFSLVLLQQLRKCPDGRWWTLFPVCGALRSYELFEI